MINWPHRFFFISLFFLLTSDCQQLKNKKLVPIRIIEEPSKSSAQYLANLQSSNRRLFNNLNLNQDIIDGLKAKYKPAKINGPTHLVDELSGKCFEKIYKNYKWIVCPFQNATQFEQDKRWNPYKGILGIWYEWEIKENKFDSMLMLNGDDCGSNGSRRVKLKLKCNEPNENMANNSYIEEISEPSTCNYEIKLLTKLACESTKIGWSMNVYPYLSDELKMEWNVLFSQLKDGLILEKMYLLALKNLYERAGYIRNNDELESLKIKEQNDDEEELIDDQVKEKLKKCEQENAKLKKELEKLKN